MSEARIRSLAQNSSRIFSNSPSETIRPRDNPQGQSKIFKPLNYIPKPLTYARAQYEKTSICLGTDKPTYECKNNANTQVLSPAGKKTNQTFSTKYLIGNEKSTFFKKSVNEKIGVPSKFEPKYKTESAFERKQKEFNSGFSPKKTEEKIEAEEKLTARERKLKDRVSVFDTKDYPLKARETSKENLKIDYDPKSRKAENFSSDVFTERKLVEFKKPLEKRENEEDRRKNHLFSDLFGRASSPKRAEVKERLVPVEHLFAASGRQNLEYNPSFQLSKNLASQIDIGDSPTKNPRNRPRTPQTALQINPVSPKSQLTKAELYDLSLTSVPSSMNAASLKELCGCIHVVTLSLEIDNFTGQCRGSGRIQLRTNDSADLERLTRVLKAKGISVQMRQTNLGRKSNYADISNVSWHNPYDYNKSRTPLGARENKMKNLESTFFEGQVKWTDRPVESFNEELFAQIQWMNTKNTSRAQY